MRAVSYPERFPAGAMTFWTDRSTHGDRRLVPQEPLLGQQLHKQHGHRRQGDGKQEVSQESQGTVASDHGDNKTQQEIDHNYHRRPPTPHLANNVPSAGDLRAATFTPWALEAGASVSILCPPRIGGAWNSTAATFWNLDPSREAVND
jgi:hypothetical protein